MDLKLIWHLVCTESLTKYEGLFDDFEKKKKNCTRRKSLTATSDRSDGDDVAMTDVMIQVEIVSTMDSHRLTIAVS